MRTFPDLTSALLVADLQPDFMSGGALAVAGADELLRPIARLIEEHRFAIVIATQDWHPLSHISFASSHCGRVPFDTVELYGHQQVLWPDHCVQGSHGAQLCPSIPWERAGVILRKGADPNVDSYSAFRSNWDQSGNRPRTGLAGFLKDRGIERVIICGVARDFCVKWTAEDARDEGFAVTVLWDLTRPVDSSSDMPVYRGLRSKGIDVKRGPF